MDVLFETLVENGHGHVVDCQDDAGGRPVAVVVVVIVFRDLAGSGMVHVNSVPDIFFFKPG